MKRLGKKAEIVYSALSKDINSRKFVENSRLPTEKELCARFGCCHNTVRKALERLIDEGMVESRRGSGSYVTNSSGSDLASTISLMYIGSHETLTKIQDAALSRDCMLAFYSHARAHWDIESEGRFLNQVKKQRHLGLLALCSPIAPYNEELLSEIQSSGTTVVHYEYYKAGIPNENFVLPDYKQAGYIATTKLMLSGCEDLYFCSIGDGTPFELLQEEGVLKALRDYSNRSELRKPFAEFNTDGNFFRMPRMGLEQDADDRLDQFISGIRPKTGIICSTLRRAEIMLHELLKRNVVVPEEVKVTGIELLNDHAVNFSAPYVTFDRDAIFQKALNAIFNPANGGIHEMVAPHFA